MALLFLALFYIFVFFSLTSTWNYILSSCMMAASGYPLGNFHTISDGKGENMDWITHLVNRYTPAATESSSPGKVAPTG